MFFPHQHPSVQGVYKMNTAIQETSAKMCLPFWNTQDLQIILDQRPMTYKCILLMGNSRLFTKILTVRLQYVT
jgi:hypothetical protein